MRLLVAVNLLWLGLSMFADGATVLVLPHVIDDHVASSLEGTVLGLATFGGLMVAALVQPFAGRLGDMLGPPRGRQVLIGAGVALVVSGGLLLGAAPTLVAVIAGYCLLMTALSVAQAGQQGLIPDLVPAEKRGRASGIKGFMDLAGAMLAFVLLGATLQSWGAGPPLAVMSAATAVLFIASGFMLRRYSGRPRPVTAQAARFSLRDVYRVDLARHEGFARLVAARFLFLLGIYAVGRFFLFLVADRLSLDSEQAEDEAAYLLAALTLVSLLCAPLGGWLADNRGRLATMTLGGCTAAAGVVLLVAADSAMLVLGFGVLMSLGSGLFAAANWAMTADLAPPDEAGRFMALANFGTAGAVAAAGLAGPLVDVGNAATAGLGYDLLLIFASGALLASTMVLRPLAEPVARPRALRRYS